MAKKITSWSTKEDGELIEGDVKFYPYQDGSYEIESTNESIGFVLGVENTHSRTVIKKVLNEKSIEKVRSLVTVGDILISINDRIVLDEPFNDIAVVLNMLMQSGCARRLRFLNPKKCPVQLYLKQLENHNNTQQDLLGFNCSLEYLIAEMNDRKMKIELISSRDLEWVKYLKSIGGLENLKPAGVYKPSSDLKAIVRKGIPVAYRAAVWQKISLSDVNRIRYPVNYYDSLLTKVKELPPRVKIDIEKDVDRTFPEHVYFESSGSGEAALRRVLQAFAVHNKEIGYCQSLNFIAGMMLIFMKEEEAFWLFVTVIEQLLPRDYYTKSMVGVYVDQFVLSHIIKKYLPKIHTVFETHQLQLPLITVQWFMCIFVNTLRPEVTLRIWDMFLNEGSKVLFRITAALFKSHEKQLLSVKDAPDLFTTLRYIGKDVLDADKLIAAAYKSYRPKQSVMKIHQLKLISPRLQSKKEFNCVPVHLTGLGVAHTGPVPTHDQLSTKLKKIKFVPNHSIRIEKVTKANQEGIEMKSENSSPDKTLEVSMISHATNERLEAVQSSTNDDSVMMLGQGGLHDDHLPPPDLELDYDIDEIYIAPRYSLGAKPLDDSGKLITGPGGMLMNNDKISDTTNESMADSDLRLEPTHRSDNDHDNDEDVTYIDISEEDRKNSQSRISELKRLSDDIRFHRAKKDLLNKKRNRVRNGELNFYRADIALWRASFRPALEDRYKKMERARKIWRERERKANGLALLPPETLNNMQIMTEKLDGFVVESVEDQVKSRGIQGTPTKYIDMDGHTTPKRVILLSSSSSLDHGLNHGTPSLEPIRIDVVPMSPPYNTQVMMYPSHNAITDDVWRLSPQADSLRRQYRSDSLNSVSYMEKIILSDVVFPLDDLENLSSTSYSELNISRSKDDHENDMNENLEDEFN